MIGKIGVPIAYKLVLNTAVFSKVTSLDSVLQNRAFLAAATTSTWRQTSRYSTWMSPELVPKGISGRRERSV